jgi:hypothetical protein
LANIFSKYMIEDELTKNQTGIGVWNGNLKILNAFRVVSGDSGGHPAAAQRNRLHNALLTPPPPEDAVRGRWRWGAPIF